MAGRFSVYGANQVLNKVLRANDFTPSTSYWIALFRAVTDTALRANSPGTADEVPGAGSYTRLQIRGATGITFSSSTLAESELSAEIAWPAATGSWGTVTRAAIMDSSTIGAGNVILFGSLTTPKAVDIGDTFRVPVTLFKVRL